MPTEPKKPLIVISYAHDDEPEKPAEGEVKWLSFVTGYLRPAIKHGAVELGQAWGQAEKTFLPRFRMSALFDAPSRRVLE